MIDGLHPLDPFQKISEQQQLLFKRFTGVAHGFANAEVAGAALNILVNSIRQNAHSRVKAQQAMDQYVEQARNMLAEHYNGHGRKKGIFPYHQVIAVPHWIDFSLRG